MPNRGTSLRDSAGSLLTSTSLPMTPRPPGRRAPRRRRREPRNRRPPALDDGREGAFDDVGREQTKVRARARDGDSLEAALRIAQVEYGVRRRHAHVAGDLHRVRQGELLGLVQTCRHQDATDAHPHLVADQRQGQARRPIALRRQDRGGRTIGVDRSHRDPRARCQRPHQPYLARSGARRAPPRSRSCSSRRPGGVRSSRGAAAEAGSLGSSEWTATKSASLPARPRLAQSISTPADAPGAIAGGTVPATQLGERSTRVMCAGDAPALVSVKTCFSPSPSRTRPKSCAEASHTSRGPGAAPGTVFDRHASAPSATTSAPCRSRRRAARLTFGRRGHISKWPHTRSRGAASSSSRRSAGNGSARWCSSSSSSGCTG